MSIVDANVILRYLLDDHTELSAKATDIIEQQAVTLPMEAACEFDGSQQGVVDTEDERR